MHALLAVDFSQGMTQTWIIVLYLAALILLGVASNSLFRGTAIDYFVASRGVGPVLLVLSVFGTTMTAFAIQGSSGEAWYSGVGVYGKLASWSAIVHAACFFLIGVKLWALGKRFGYQTQIQFFRDRFKSSNIGVVLFPILVLLQMPYIIIGILGSGVMINVATAGAFPDFALFHDANPRLSGGVPFWLGTLLATGVVWLYVWLGGARATAWANALQTIIFLVVGVVTFGVIGEKLGGFEQATRMVQEYNPSKLAREVTPAQERNYDAKMAAWRAWKASTQPAVTAPAPKEATLSTAPSRTPPVLRPHKPEPMSELEFFSYGFIPLSVAMFPHLFQLWLTARSARAFRLTVVLHPILIMLIWVPCVLIGVWATSAIIDGRIVVPFTNETMDPSRGQSPNAVIGLMVNALGDPVVGGLLAAGVLAAILGGMDAQFLSIGSMFTHDIVDHYARHDSMSDKQKLTTGRLFVILIVLVSWLATLLLRGAPIFTLGIWCFSGFASLFPLVLAALYWKRATKWGAYASIIAGVGSGVAFYVYNGLTHGFASRVEAEVLIPFTNWSLVPAAPMVVNAAIALVVVSLLTPPPPREHVEKFFSRSSPSRAAA